VIVIVAELRENSTQFVKGVEHCPIGSVVLGVKSHAKGLT
jgi:hypothetical protein